MLTTFANKKNPHNFAKDGKGASIWDSFSHERGRVWHGQNGDHACDHYHRLEEDVQRMRDMGLRAYRFSISWPRLFPDGTVASERAEGVAFYRRLLRLLGSRARKTGASAAPAGST